MLQKKNISVSGFGSTGISNRSVAAFAIAAVTLITYANVLGSFYLYADEAWTFGTHLPHVDLWTELTAAAITWGRPIGMFVQWLQAWTVEISVHLLILNRILSLAAVGAIAWLTFKAMPHRELASGGLAWLPIAAAVYLVLIPAAQIHAAFSILLGSSLGLILSFVSYRWLDRKWGWLATFVALIVCLLTYQPSAFFILVAFAADLWRRHETESTALREFAVQRGRLLFGVLIGACVVFTTWFKLAGTGEESRVYERAQPFFDLIDGDIVPFLTMFMKMGFGLNVFELWSYPPYVPYLWLISVGFWLLTLIGLVAMNITAIRRSPNAAAGERRRTVVLGMAAAFLMTLAPVVIDGFSARQNLYYAAQGVMVLNIAFCISVLVQSARGAQNLLIASSFIIAAQIFMASTSVTISIIRPQLLVVDFVATKLRDSGLRPGSKINIVTVSGPVGFDCAFEPCTGFFGRRLNADFELTQAGLYERIAERYGYNVTAFGHVAKPDDPRSLALGDPLVVIDLDELRAIYSSDRVQM